MCFIDMIMLCTVERTIFSSASCFISAALNWFPLEGLHVVLY